MKLKSVGTLVRAGMVVIGGFAVVLIAAENFSTARNTEMLIPPVTVLNGSSETMPESGFVSAAISSDKDSIIPQSSSSVSAEDKVEPPVFPDDPGDSAEPENLIPEVPRTEESIPPISSTIVDEQISPVSIPSTSDITEASFSSSEKPSVSSSTNSVSGIGSSVSEPPDVSTIKQSSSKPTSAASSKPVELPPVQSIESVPSVPENSEPDTVNINTATSEELQELWGIGADKADAIISYRENFGDFTDIHDIRRVDGIGDVVFEGISDHITV